MVRSHRELEEKVVAFYKHYAPDKLASEAGRSLASAYDWAADLIAEWASEEDMWAALQRKYGPWPLPAGASPVRAAHRSLAKVDATGTEVMLPVRLRDVSRGAAGAAASLLGGVDPTPTQANRLEENRTQFLRRGAAGSAHGLLESCDLLGEEGGYMPVRDAPAVSAQERRALAGELACLEEYLLYQPTNPNTVTVTRRREARELSAALVESVETSEREKAELRRCVAEQEALLAEGRGVHENRQILLEAVRRELQEAKAFAPLLAERVLLTNVFLHGSRTGGGGGRRRGERDEREAERRAAKRYRVRVDVTTRAPGSEAAAQDKPRPAEPTTAEELLLGASAVSAPTSSCLFSSFDEPPPPPAQDAALAAAGPAVLALLVLSYYAASAPHLPLALPEGFGVVVNANGTVVRAGEATASAEVGRLRHNDVVFVARFSQANPRRAELVHPVKGWISLVSGKGALLVAWVDPERPDVRAIVVPGYTDGGRDGAGAAGPATPHRKGKVVAGNGTVVREGEAAASAEVCRLTAGTQVTVAQVRGRRAEIVAPEKGWLSLKNALGGVLVELEDDGDGDGDPPEFPKKGLVLAPKGTVVRAEEGAGSAEVCRLDAKTVVVVEEVRGRRARISSPQTGWLSLTNQAGATLVRVVENKKKAKKEEEPPEVLQRAKVLAPKGVVVRVSEDPSSEEVTRVPKGEELTVAVVNGRRARLVAPTAGWISISNAAGKKLISELEEVKEDEKKKGGGGGDGDASDSETEEEGEESGAGGKGGGGGGDTGDPLSSIFTEEEDIGPALYPASEATDAWFGGAAAVAAASPSPPEAGESKEKKAAAAKKAKAKAAKAKKEEGKPFRIRRGKVANPFERVVLRRARGDDGDDDESGDGPVEVKDGDDAVPVRVAPFKFGRDLWQGPPPVAPVDATPFVPPPPPPPREPTPEEEGQWTKEEWAEWNAEQAQKWEDEQREKYEGARQKPDPFVRSAVPSELAHALAARQGVALKRSSGQLPPAAAMVGCVPAVLGRAYSVRPSFEHPFPAAAAPSGGDAADTAGEGEGGEQKQEGAATPRGSTAYVATELVVTLARPEDTAVYLLLYTEGGRGKRLPEWVSEGWYPLPQYEVPLVRRRREQEGGGGGGRAGRAVEEEEEEDRRRLYLEVWKKKPPAEGEDCAATFVLPAPYWHPQCGPGGDTEFEPAGVHLPRYVLVAAERRRARQTGADVLRHVREVNAGELKTPGRRERLPCIGVGRKVSVLEQGRHPGQLLKRLGADDDVLRGLWVVAMDRKKAGAPRPLHIYPEATLAPWFGQLKTVAGVTFLAADPRQGGGTADEGGAAAPASLFPGYSTDVGLGEFKVYQEDAAGGGGGGGAEPGSAAGGDAASAAPASDLLGGSSRRMQFKKPVQAGRRRANRPLTVTVVVEEDEVDGAVLGYGSTVVTPLDMSRGSADVSVPIHAVPADAAFFSDPNTEKLLNPDRSYRKLLNKLASAMAVPATPADLRVISKPGSGVIVVEQGLKVRKGVKPSTELVTVLPQHTVVEVAEFKQRRVRLVSPVEGWLTVQEAGANGRIFVGRQPTAAEQRRLRESQYRARAELRRSCAEHVRLFREKKRTRLEHFFGTHLVSRFVGADEAGALPRAPLGMCAALSLQNRGVTQPLPRFAREIVSELLKEKSDEEREAEEGGGSGGAPQQQQQQQRTPAAEEIGEGGEGRVLRVPSLLGSPLGGSQAGAAATPQTPSATPPPPPPSQPRDDVLS